MDPQAAAALLAATPVSRGPSWPKPPLWSSAALKRTPSSSLAAAGPSSSSAAAKGAQGGGLRNAADDNSMSHQSAAKAAEAEAAASTAALHAATPAPQTPLELAASVVEAVPGIKHSHATSHGQQDASPPGAQHAQQQQQQGTSHRQQGQETAKLWGGVEYDSNFADIDGTLHVFSDTAMTDEEEDAPPQPKQKYVLLDRVPQVCLFPIFLSCCAVCTSVQCFQQTADAIMFPSWTSDRAPEAC